MIVREKKLFRWYAEGLPEALPQRRFRDSRKLYPHFPCLFQFPPSHKAKELKVMARWAGMNMDVSFAFWKETAVHNSKLARSATERGFLFLC